MGGLLVKIMRRYWLPIKNSLNIGDTIQIEGEIFHHIFDVCRQDIGSHFEILGDQQNAHLVKVLSKDKKRAKAEIIETRQLPALPTPRVVLALSVPRFPVLEAVLEKAVEMGVSRIQPFFSDNSFVRKQSSWPEAKSERWKKIIVSATQQSGRGDLMQFPEPVDLDQLLVQIKNQNAQTPINPASRNHGLSSNKDGTGKIIKGLFAYEGETTLNISEALANFKEQQADEIWIFVGSEGGFSQTEVEKFRQAGLEPISLGDQVLRVETACITLIAILKYELGHMRRHQ